MQEKEYVINRVRASSVNCYRRRRKERKKKDCLVISSSFVKSSAVKKIGKRTTLHLECRKKWKEKKAEKSRGESGESSLYLFV